MEIAEIECYNTLSVNNLDSSPSSLDPSIESLDTGDFKEDLWSFGYFWEEIATQFGSIENLYHAIQDLHSKIKATKEKFRALSHPLFPGEIIPNHLGGISNSYFLLDNEGNRCFVIKPVDEDIGCLNNGQHFATPFVSSPIRENMTLYLSSLREVLAYNVAMCIGAGSVVPRTVLTLLESNQFHDLSDGVATSERMNYLETCGSGDREKLCSAQEYVPNSKSLFEALQDFQILGLSDDEIAQRFDQAEFEDLNILLWTTYDTDGHMGNFLVYPKGTDSIGNEILGLKKIDNGLAFPDQNEQLRNNLAFLPNALLTLSDEARAKIGAIDVEELAKQFELFGLESAIPALLERVAVLQSLALTPSLTIKQINQTMSNLRRKDETHISFSQRYSYSI